MAAVVFFTSVIVAVFYCLGALQSERRDRSILFWKSLPVSDLTTVASKAIIPLLVLPVVTGVVILVAQAVMLLLSTVVYIASGDSALTLWMQLPLDRMTVTLLWGLLAVSLWYAPIYGWLLLVSGWARRAAFLWAFLTPLALAVVEKVAFDTDYVGHLIRYRIAGFMRVAFNSAETNITPDPVQFASTPGLWVGLAFAAVFLAAAVWQRRYREPI
jgi:ABC-2 type transport system permease protein